MDRNLPHADGIHSVQFSPDSKLIVTAGEDFVARIWNRETGQQITPPLRHRHQVWAATFNPDGRWIATISVDKTARLWDARTGDPLAPPCLLPEMGTSIVFLDNLPRLLLGGTRGNSWIWDLSPDNPSPQELDRLARTLTGTAVTSESPAYR
jgi:WD40 repeat protein